MRKFSNFVTSGLMVSTILGAVIASGCNGAPDYIRSLVYCGTVMHHGKPLSGGNIVYHFKWYSNGAYSEGQMTPTANPNGTGNIDANGVACAQGKVGSAISSDFEVKSITGTSIVDAEGNPLPDTGDSNRTSEFDDTTKDMKASGTFNVGDIKTAKNQVLIQKIRSLFNLDRVKIDKREATSGRSNSGRSEGDATQQARTAAAGAAI